MNFNRLHFSTQCIILGITLAFGYSTSCANATDLQLRFVYDGPAPAAESIEATKDKDFCGKCNLKSERLIVNKNSKGIQNVLVYLYTGRRGTELPEPRERYPGRNVVQKVENCRIEPRILLMRTNDTLVSVECDLVQHSLNIPFFKNGPLSGLRRPREPLIMTLTQEEPAPIPVECNIHPWMKAYVVVLDHSFAAVSDSDGNVCIKGLPNDRDLIFRVFHEAGTIDEVNIEGKSIQWERSRFELKAGERNHDLGDVVLSPRLFTVSSASQ